ncbi:MAG: hypothetical protein K5641_07060 [Lachnospiraceae bacterium]|nr:hypothetical protein [Lachnospiraceae bacterium]
MERSKRIIRITLLLAGFVMLLMGIVAGGYRDIWTKAVMVCMECVGIG